MHNIAIILASGSGTRCGFDKLFTSQFGTPIIERTLKTFQKSQEISEIFLSIKEEKQNSPQIKKLQEKFPKISHTITGGSERFFSLLNTLEFLEKNPPQKKSRLIIHNGANGHLTIPDLESGLKKAEENPNIIFGYFTPNSIKKTQNGKVVDFLDRTEIFETQTPQIAPLNTFIKAKNCWKKSIEKNCNVSLPNDEAELISLIGEEIYIHECERTNTKTTYSSDFENYKMTELRIGLGEDSHRFTEKFIPEKLIVLGGITFPESQLSFEANSDGDVILHALCNALLSSIGEKTFDPIAAPLCKSGITDSSIYLQETLKLITKNRPNFRIKNIIISLECIKPKIAKSHDLITKNIAKLLNINISQIGLTYTTGENLTDFGKGLGIRSTVQILVEI